MKNFILGSCLLAIASFSSIAAHEANKSYELYKISEMTEEQLQEFFSGENPQVTVEIPEGLNLPLNLSLQGEFLALASNIDALYTLKVSKTCFIRCFQNMFFFSADLQSWSPFQEFFTGCIGVSLNVTDSYPSVSLNVDLNKRD